MQRSKEILLEKRRVTLSIVYSVKDKPVIEGDTLLMITSRDGSTTWFILDS